MELWEEEHGDVIGVQCLLCSQYFTSGKLCDWKISIMSTAKEELLFIKDILNSQLASHLSKFHTTFGKEEKEESDHKPLSCIICYKFYSKHRNFQRHLRVNHPKEIEEDQNIILDHFNEIIISNSLEAYLSKGTLRLKRIDPVKSEHPTNNSMKKSLWTEITQGETKHESSPPPFKRLKADDEVEQKETMNKINLKSNVPKVDKLIDVKEESIDVEYHENDFLDKSSNSNVLVEGVEAIEEPPSKKAKQESSNSKVPNEFGDLVQFLDDPPEYESEGVECSYCHLILIDEHSLAFHYSKNHVPIEKEGPSRKLKCNSCNETLPDAPSFREHLSKNHIRNRPIHNCLCSKAFLSSAAYENHVKRCLVSISVLTKSPSSNDPTKLESNQKEAKSEQVKNKKTYGHGTKMTGIVPRPLMSLMPLLGFLSDSAKEGFDSQTNEPQVPNNSSQTESDDEMMIIEQNKPENEAINNYSAITVFISDVIEVEKAPPAEDENSNKESTIEIPSPNKSITENGVNGIINESGEIKNEADKIKNEANESKHEVIGNHVAVEDDDDDFITLHVTREAKIPSTNKNPDSNLTISDTQTQIPAIVASVEQSDENLSSIVINPESSAANRTYKDPIIEKSIHESPKKDQNDSEKEFACSEDWCGKRFKTLQEHSDHSKFHLNFMHVKQEILACKECAFTFKPIKGLSILEAHADTHVIHQQFVCKICLNNFTKRFTLSAHYKAKHSMGFHEYFEKIAQLANPSNERLSKIYKKRRFECTECNTMFLKNREFLLHKKLHDFYRFIPLSNSKMKYQCNKCGIFVVCNQRRLHAKSHGNWKGETDKSLPLETNGEIQIVDLEAPEVLPPSHDVPTIPIQAKPKGPIKKRGKKRALTLEELEDVRIAAETKSKEDMAEAIKFALGPRIKVPILKKFHCVACNSVYLNGEEFQTHLKLHDHFRVFQTPERVNAFECIKCLICVNGSQLDTHDCENENFQISLPYSIMHTEGSEEDHELNYSLNIGTGVLEPTESLHFPFDCKFCILPLPSFETLKAHLASFHRVIEKPICKYCFEVFPTEEEEFLHYANFHFEEGEDGGKLDCKVCLDTMEYPVYFREHVKGAHCEVENKCGICNKKFPNETEFITHMELIHPRIKLVKFDENDDDDEDD